MPRTCTFVISESRPGCSSPPCCSGEIQLLHPHKSGGTTHGFCRGPKYSSWRTRPVTPCCGWAGQVIPFTNSVSPAQSRSRLPSRIDTTLSS